MFRFFLIESKKKKKKKKIVLIGRLKKLQENIRSLAGLNYVCNQAVRVSFWKIRVIPSFSHHLIRIDVALTHSLLSLSFADFCDFTDTTIRIKS